MFTTHVLYWINQDRDVNVFRMRPHMNLLTHPFCLSKYPDYHFIQYYRFVSSILMTLFPLFSHRKTFHGYQFYSMPCTCLQLSDPSDHEQQAPWMTCWHFSCPPDVSTTSPTLTPFGAAVKHSAWSVVPPTLSSVLEILPCGSCRSQLHELTIAATWKISC